MTVNVGDLAAKKLIILREVQPLFSNLRYFCGIYVEQLTNIAFE